MSKPTEAQPERTKRPGARPSALSTAEVAPAPEAGPLSRSSLLALQRSAGNRVARSTVSRSRAAGAPPQTRLAGPETAARLQAAPDREASAPIVETEAQAGHVAANAPPDLATRWSEAQHDVARQFDRPVAEAQPPIRRATPMIRPGNKKDKTTMAGDALSVGAGGASAAKSLGEGISAPLVGEVIPAVDILEFSSAAGEILGFVALGLNIFSLGENLVRGWDAKIRLAAFTKAYQQLPENDPLRPYLVEAAKQQKWEKNRRWIRVAVTATVLALTIAALAGATGGAFLLAIAAVLAIGKAIETMRNLWRKYQAKKQQKAAATEMLRQAYAAGSESQTYKSFTELLGALNIPVPDSTLPRKDFEKQKSYAIDQLAPHLSRSDEAIKQALPQQAEAFVQAGDAQANAQIAQVQAAAGAQGVDAEAAAQAGGGQEAEPALPGQPEAVAS